MNIGIIGLGKMGGALARGMLRMQAVAPEHLHVFDHHPENISTLSDEYPGICPCRHEEEVLKAVDVLILAIKPSSICPLLAGLERHDSRPWPVVISVATGVSTANMQEVLCPEVRIIRAMPNTPCMTGHGMIAYCLGEFAGEQDKRLIEELFKGCGSLLQVKESQMDAVSAISGCGPAYMFVALDALADAGVACGLTRADALALASATMSGAALMQQTLRTPPMVLRDAVTSPGGTTIAALNALDACGFRHALISAVKAAVRRSEELSK